MSTKFPEYKGLNLPNVAKEMLKYWEENNIFEKSVTTREGNKPYVFFEGPPSANGLPGVHHVLARAIKDIFPRYKTMKGFQVKRKAGWDTHGLPIELGVEKELGITKEDIGKTISVEEYNAACRKAVMRYTGIWNDLTQKMGYWVNMDDPYVTYEPKYMESVWWLLKQIYEKNLMYKGYTIQPYSPKAGTGLSSHELNQPGTYQDVTDTTVVAQFKAINETLPSFLQKQGAVYFLAWTTTPWTLPSNTALTVGSKIEYVLVDTFNQYTFEPTKVILAKKLVGKQFGGKNSFKVDTTEELKEYTSGNKKIPFYVVKEFVGKDLVGIRYEQLLQYVLPNDNPQDAFRVISGDFVTTEDGTGIVHTSPTFGADDALVAKQATPEIPPMLIKDENDNLVPLVDLQGKFVKELGEFGGKYVKNEYYKDGEAPEKSIDVELAIKLKEENKAFKVEKYKHSYPNCWRTDKPILYYPLDSWFVKAASVKERMFELNKTINWKPASTGEGRFGKWLENLQDWNLSRSRFWGIPLPIWRTEDGEGQKCISSIEELTREIEHANNLLGKDQEVPKDLHRPYIDDVILATEDGQPMKRELDLIDVWFDSGSMPYAQWHYPFENKEKFERNFPADFIAEGVDQTRGWFYTLHAIATMVFDNVAYKNVVSNGLVLAKNGVKMSKRLGNAVEPFEALSTYGADANRWYMIANSPPWDNLKFDIDGVDEKRKKFFGTLFNMYNFFATYANIDGFEMDENNVTAISERPEIDKWIISKLNSLIKSYTVSMDDYEMTKACRDIENFALNDLSNWYVRLCRRRFWKSDSDADKRAAYETLYECMIIVSQLMSAVAPFFAEWLYRNLTDPIRKNEKVNGGRWKHDSVHLTFLTKANHDLIDEALEERMDYAQRISSLVLSIRKKENHRVRQPLQKILLPVLDSTFQAQVEAVKDLILSEVNVKEIEYLTETTGFIKKKIKPNFKTLGRKLGKNMKAAAATIGGLTQEDIGVIEKSNSYQLVIGEENYELTLEDFEITSDDIPGWTVANDGALTVALDVTVTDDLLAEGTARELVNRIQNIRKTRDFNVTDKIVVTLENHESIRPALEQFSDYICTETLAISLNTKSDVKGEVIELNDQVSLNIQVELS